VTHLHWLLTSPAAGVERLLFLFNAAFVKPLYKPMQERHLQAGLKVYGCSQLMTQQMPRDHGGAYGQKSMGLPCFNAASAYTNGALGKAHWLALQCLVLGAGISRPTLSQWATFSVHEAIDAARRVTGRPMALPDSEPSRQVAEDSPVHHRPERAQQFAKLPNFFMLALGCQQRTKHG
jgi:UDP-glucose 4-epimerase